MRASRVMISRGASRVRGGKKERPQHLGGQAGAVPDQAAHGGGHTQLFQEFHQAKGSNVLNRRLLSFVTGLYVSAGAWSSSMEDLKSKLEKLLSEAEDCELIGRLATDPNKRELFKKLAKDLRAMANDIRVVIASST